MAHRKLALFVVLALAAAFGLAAVALARGDGRPRTDPVTATFDVSLVKGKFRECRGQDGRYAEFTATFRGPIVSSDPRLTGEAEVRAHTLHNDTTEYGTVEGFFVVRDPDTRNVRLVADLRGVESPDVAGPHGFIFGRVADGRPSGGGEASRDDATAASRLFANFTSRVEPGGRLIGQLGGTSEENATPAVIQRGHCAGPFADAP